MYVCIFIQLSVKTIYFSALHSQTTTTGKIQRFSSFRSNENINSLKEDGSYRTVPTKEGSGNESQRKLCSCIFVHILHYENTTMQFAAIFPAVEITIFS